MLYGQKRRQTGHRGIQVMIYRGFALLRLQRERVGFEAYSSRGGTANNFGSQSLLEKEYTITELRDTGVALHERTAEKVLGLKIDKRFAIACGTPTMHKNSQRSCSPTCQPLQKQQPFCHADECSSISLGRGIAGVQQMSAS